MSSSNSRLSKSSVRGFRLNDERLNSSSSRCQNIGCGAPRKFLIDMEVPNGFDLSGKPLTKWIKIPVCLRCLKLFKTSGIKSSLQGRIP